MVLVKKKLSQFNDQRDLNVRNLDSFVIVKYRNFLKAKIPRFQFIWVYLTFFCFSVSSSLFSLPVGNPCAASIYTNGIVTHGKTSPCSFLFPWTSDMHLRTGFYGDYAFERKLMRLNHRNRAGDDRCAQIGTNALILVVNTFDWVEAFGTIGASHLKIESRSNVTLTDTLLDFQTGTSWSFGLRATGARFGKILIGGEAQYFRTDPQVCSYTNFGTGSVTYLPNTNSANYEEWQVGFGASAFIESSYHTAFSPYISVNVSNVRGDLRDIQFQDGDQTINLFDLTASKIWGIAIGATYLLNRQIGLTVEGRFANETALYVSGQITW